MLYRCSMVRTRVSSLTARNNAVPTFAKLPSSKDAIPKDTSFALPSLLYWIRIQDMTKPPRAFVAFDYDNDSTLRDFLFGQAKHPDTNFEMHDWSVKEP